MRIVHLVDYFMPQMGYQEFYLAREHQRVGHQVRVVTSDRYYPFVDYENTLGKVLGKRIVGEGERRERGIKVVRRPVIFEYAPSALIFIKDLKTTLNFLKPEVVFCDGLFSFNAILAAWYQNALGYSLVYDNHASDYNTQLTDTPVKKIYINFLFKPIFVPLIKQRAKAIVSAVGEAEQDFIVQHLNLPKNKVPIIPLGVEIYSKKKTADWREEIRKEFGLADDEVGVVTAGKIDKRKRIEDLIEAVRALKSDKIRLFVLGSGEKNYVKKLMGLVKRLKLRKKVVFLGAYKEVDEARLLSGFDIGIWPGVHSQATRKALAVGLPIVLPEKVSRTQTSQFLLSYDNGLTFKKGDVESLVGAIKKLVGNKSMRVKMGENSKRLAKEKLSWSKIAKEYLKVAGVA